ncbi:hypothetical protein QM996_09230 [Sinorhizobium chiapasense]|uniref:hypothetical protein n=1 Tax=Ensifer sesbaniae TaxID=1214071 RepID=UPI0015694421|nr:hypothetical protein [Ensifer sesbaniae]NRQ15121.1 hypothetical protein [Ensifer sesbaniae]
MKPEERAAAARAILDVPYFNEVMNELEWAAINGCIHAGLTDDQGRAAYAAEARAIRNFRARLKFLTEQAKADGKGAPA